MTSRVCAALWAYTFGYAGQAVTSAEVLKQLRKNTEQQVTRTVDYLCTETVNRTEYQNLVDVAPGCNHLEKTVKQPYQHDRLRLDVAVSSTGEMFSWHGMGAFSNTGIETVVQSGAVSSGTFVGYFGQVASRAEQTMSFTYDVSLPSSRQQLLVGAQKVAVPFHGSFVADLQTNQLKSLDVVIDHSPQSSEVCFAEQTITYQVKQISDTPALIPQKSTLAIDSLRHRYSQSETEFSGCHAFRGESTVHYSAVADPPVAPLAPLQIEKDLERVRVHAFSSTDINSESSYTGDPVHGTLLSPVKIGGTEIHIRKGAAVEGVITRLAFRYVPEPHYVLAISTDKIIDGNRTFLLHTRPRTSGGDWQLLSKIYGGSRDLDSGIAAEGRRGEFLFTGRKFHTGARLQGVWVTAPSIGRE